MTALPLPSLSLPRRPGAAFVAGYVALYVALDWVSFIDPLGPLGITPWNPPPGLSLFLLLRYGLAMTPWLFVAAFLAEVLVRGVPAPWPVIVAACALLAGGYALVAALLRGRLRFHGEFTTLRDVTVFTAVAATATLVIGLAYIALFVGAGVIAPDAYVRSVAQFWIGDLIGVVVTTPLLLVATRARAPAYRAAPREGTPAGGAASSPRCTSCSGPASGQELKLFYVLFLPLTWIAMRRGLAGTTAATLLVQIGLIAALLFGGHAARRGARLPVPDAGAGAHRALSRRVGGRAARRRGETARQAGRTRPEPARGGRERARVHARARTQPAAVGDRHLHAFRADPARTRRPRRRIAGDDAQGRRGGEPGRHGDAPAARVRADGIGPPGAAASRPRCWRTPRPPRCRARSSITCC